MTMTGIQTFLIDLQMLTLSVKYGKIWLVGYLKTKTDRKAFAQKLLRSQSPTSDGQSDTG